MKTLRKLRKGKIYCIPTEVVQELKGSVTAEDILKIGVYIDDCCDNTDFGNHYYVIME